MNSSDEKWAVGNPETVSSTRVGLYVLAAGFLFAALLFVPARRLDWIQGWVYLGLVLVYVLVNWACLARWNPQLIARRMRLGQGTKSWDIVWSVIFAPLMLAVYLVAGLEARGHQPGFPSPSWHLGLLIFLSGAGLLTWSMVVNPFFEKTVRIQTEYGHYVIDTGPYAWVRHPGYAGFGAWILSAPLLLGSGRAFLPALLALLTLVARTVLEDATLQAELAGYRDYAARVQFRLLPWVW